MMYKLPCRTQRYLSAGKGDLCKIVSITDADIYYPQALNVAVYLSRLRPPVPVSVPNDATCNHPSESITEQEGQYVCTICGLCTGSVYERPVYNLDGSGLTVVRKHFYRPEAYLKTHIKKLGKNLPNWAAGRLHKIWPYVFKLFKRITTADTGARKPRKNMLSYSFVIERLLYRWSVNTTILVIKPIKTVSRRREANRLWNLVEPKLPAHL